MSLPEGYLPREGDTLIILAKVKHSFDPGDTMVHVVPEGHYSAIAIDLDKILGLYARAWDIDARVLFEGSEGIVAAVYGSSVWVRFGEGDTASFETVEANELRPAPPAAMEAPEPAPPAPPPMPDGAPVPDEEIQF